MKTKIIRKILAVIVVVSIVMSASGLVSAGKGKKDGNSEKTKPATSSVHEKRKNNDLSDKKKKLKEENENFAKSITQKLTPGKKYSKEEMVDIFNKLLTCLKTPPAQDTLKRQVAYDIVYIKNHGFLENFSGLEDFLRVATTLGLCNSDDDQTAKYVLDSIEYLISEEILSKENLNKEKEETVTKYIMCITNILPNCVKKIKDQDLRERAKEYVDKLIFNVSLHKYLEHNIGAIAFTVSKFATDYESKGEVASTINQLVTGFNFEDCREDEFRLLMQALKRCVEGNRKCVFKAISILTFKVKLSKERLNEVFEVIYECANDVDLKEDIENFVKNKLMKSEKFDNLNNKEKLDISKKILEKCDLVAKQKVYGYVSEIKCAVNNGDKSGAVEAISELVNMKIFKNPIQGDVSYILGVLRECADQADLREQISEVFWSLINKDALKNCDGRDLLAAVLLLYRCSDGYEKTQQYNLKSYVLGSIEKMLKNGFFENCDKNVARCVVDILAKYVDDESCLEIARALKEKPAFKDLGSELCEIIYRYYH